MPENPAEFADENLAWHEPRKLGFFSLGAGLVIIYLAIDLPLQHARASATQIELNAKYIVMGTGLVFLGLAFLLLGKSAAQFFNPISHHWKIRLVAVGLVLAIIGHGAYVWLKHFLETK